MNINEFEMSNVTSDICDMLVKTIIKAEGVDDDFEELILPFSDILIQIDGMEDGKSLSLISGEDVNELFKLEWISEWAKQGEDKTYAEESFLPHLDFCELTLPRWVVIRAANACAAISLMEVRQMRKIANENEKK
jgi:hypothetical protein